MIENEENKPEQIHLVVKKKYTSKRIDKYLVSRLQDHSRNVIQNLIKDGNIKVNNNNVKSSYEIKFNDDISILLPVKRDDTITPENIPLNILYEDDYLIVLNKSPDMVVHPARGHARGTLVNALMFHWNKLSSINGPLRPGIIHRLDRDTSGAILVIKDDKIHKHIALQFEKREVDKEYIAVVQGEIELDSDKIDLPIGRHWKNGLKMAVRYDIGKNAVSIYEVIERFCGFTLVKIILETGRTHQIRVHMKNLGHPVVADSTYSNMEVCRIEDLIGQISNREMSDLVKTKEFHNELDGPVINRQALHAYKIRFFHPVLDKHMEFTANIPEDMLNLIDMLRRINTFVNNNTR